MLLELRKEPSKLTHLSNKLNLPNQEVSRQLTRLATLDLIYKDDGGAFHLTPYAGHVLRLLPGYDFLSNNRIYFKTHTAEELPIGFQLRIGELSPCLPLGDVMTSLYEVRQMICEASEYLYMIQEQANMGISDCLEDAIRRGVEYKLMLPSDVIPSEYFVEYLRSWGPDHPMLSENSDRRFLSKISIAITMSEKEVSQIIFPTVEGKLDYVGFKTKDQGACDWCREVFEHYWDGAMPKIPEQLKDLYPKSKI